MTRIRTIVAAAALTMTAGAVGGMLAPGFVGADYNPPHYSVSRGFQPAGGTRILDTRETQRLTAGVPVTVTVPRVLHGAGEGDKPAAAVAINITVTGPSAAGFVAVWPEGNQPPVSNVNFEAGDTEANFAIVALTVGETFQLVSSVDADVAVDLFGAFDASKTNPIP